MNTDHFHQFVTYNFIFIILNRTANEKKKMISFFYISLVIFGKIAWMNVFYENTLNIS